MIRIPGSEKKNEDVTYSAVEVGANRSDTNGSREEERVPGWPTRAQRLSNAALWIIGGLLVLFMPIAFIGKLSTSN